MEYVEHAEPKPEPISIARCRELLGEDAESMTDQDIEDIRRHAETISYIVVEISDELFYRVQAILSGRVPNASPRQRAHPDFPLRGFVRCESCGRGLTGSWSKGRNEYYAYYHCRPGRRSVNISKARLEGLFADELALLRNRVRRKSVCWNRRNRTGLQLLAGNQNRK